MRISQTLAVAVLSFTLSTALPANDTAPHAVPNKRGVHIEQVTETKYGALHPNDDGRPKLGFVKVRLVNDVGTTVNPPEVPTDKWMDPSNSLVIDTFSADGFSNYTLAIKTVDHAGGDMTLTLNVPGGGPAVFTEESITKKCKVGGADKHGAKGSNYRETRQMDCGLL